MKRGTTLRRLAWATDIHLNFVQGDVRGLREQLAGAGPDGLVITGDISEAPTLERDLAALDRALWLPTFIVLGNHDFYGGSVRAVRALVTGVCRRSRWLRYLPAEGVVPLGADTALVGHDGWADGRLGRLRALVDRAQRLPRHRGSRPGSSRRRGSSGCTSSATRRPRTSAASCRRRSTVSATSSWPRTCHPSGRLAGTRARSPTTSNLPHFGCGAVGQALLPIMRSRPEQRMLVLCGHTHGRGVARILPNLVVKTGGADLRTADAGGSDRYGGGRPRVGCARAVHARPQAPALLPRPAGRRGARRRAAGHAGPGRPDRLRRRVHVPALCQPPARRRRRRVEPGRGLGVRRDQLAPPRRGDGAALAASRILRRRRCSRPPLAARRSGCSPGWWPCSRSARVIRACAATGSSGRRWCCPSSRIARPSSFTRPPAWTPCSRPWPMPSWSSRPCGSPPRPRRSTVLWAALAAVLARARPPGQRSVRRLLPGARARAAGPAAARQAAGALGRRRSEAASPCWCSPLGSASARRCRSRSSPSSPGTTATSPASSPGTRFSFSRSSATRPGLSSSRSSSSPIAPGGGGRPCCSGPRWRASSSSSASTRSWATSAASTIRSCPSSSPRARWNSTPGCSAPGKGRWCRAGRCSGASGWPRSPCWPAV